MTRRNADGTEIVAVSVEHANAYHEIDDEGEPACGVDIDWIRKREPEAQRAGLHRCEHCTGDVEYGSGSRTVNALLDAQPTITGP